MTTPRHPAMALDAEALLQHSAWLARFARALVASESELDDVVQQTFAQALAQPPRHARNLRGWLGAIARNVVRTRARSDSARVAREVALPPPPPVETPDQAVERAELRRMVVEAVLALSEPYRSTVILRFFEEQEVAAVARLTKTGEDTVRTRLRRGVARVRELLERRVVDEKPKAADEGAAARALLYVHLREIAASARPSAGAGGGGATGSAAASRGLVSAGGRSIASSSVRKILVGAATVVVATGSWWWWKESDGRQARASDTVAKHESAATGAAARESPPSVPVAVERTAEVAPPQPPVTPPPPPAPCPVKSGTIRGVVTGPDGRPNANSYVWAIASPSFEPVGTTPGFGTTAQEAAQRLADGHALGLGTWIEADHYGDDGTYEIRGLPVTPGWAIGAFDPDVGAVLTDVLSFDRDHGELVVDVKLVRGLGLRGRVVDENRSPIGNVEVTLFTIQGKSVTRSDIVAAASGPHVGEFDVGFRCGDSLELECRAPGFIRSARMKIGFADNATGARVTVTLRHRPGKIVRGRIVDPSGQPLALEPILAERLTTTMPAARPTKVSVRATPSDAPAGSKVTDGRIDYVAGQYEVVVDDGFRGTLELRIADAVVGTAPFPDPTQPPDLHCDVDRIPREGGPTTFAVRFVDAETKEPIDLAEQLAPPQGSYRTSIVAQIRPDSDPKLGFIKYGCEPGPLKIRALIPGYAACIHELVVPAGPQGAPPILAIPRATAGVRGVVFHSDGRPFAKAPITVFRVTPEGLNDTTGTSVATNPDGEFEFTSLAKGEHVLVVSGIQDEACGITRFVATAPSPDVEVRCTAGTATRLRIDATRSEGDPPDTRLRIVDRNGLVVEDVHRAWVLEKRSLDEYTATLRDGHYTAVVGRDGYRDNSIEFEVPARGAIDILLVPVDPRAK